MKEMFQMIFYLSGGGRERASKQSSSKSKSCLHTILEPRAGVKSCQFHTDALVSSGFVWKCMGDSIPLCTP